MNWNRTTVTRPPEGERLLVSDGETTTIARYITSENHDNWIFDNPLMKDIKLDYWMPLPKLPQKIEQVAAEQ